MTLDASGHLHLNGEIRSDDALCVGAASVSQALYLLKTMATASPIAFMWNDGNMSTLDLYGLTIRLGADGGTTNPANTDLYVRFQKGDGTTLATIRGDGAGGIETTMSLASDRLLKRDITERQDWLDLVCAMGVYEFTYDPPSAKMTPERRQGVMHDEIPAELGWAVQPREMAEDGTVSRYAHVHYDRLIPAVIGAVQALARRLSALEAR
jgi:hypothetical protein